MTFLTTF